MLPSRARGSASFVCLFVFGTEWTDVFSGDGATPEEFLRHCGGMIIINTFIGPLGEFVFEPSYL